MLLADTATSQQCQHSWLQGSPVSGSSAEIVGPSQTEAVTLWRMAGLMQPLGHDSFYHVALLLPRGVKSQPLRDKGE